MMKKNRNNISFPENQENKKKVTGGRPFCIV